MNATRAPEQPSSRARMSLPKGQLEQFCVKYHIRRFSLFGSVLRDDFTPESDIDILVEFETGYKVGYLKMARMENELPPSWAERWICAPPQT